MTAFTKVVLETGPDGRARFREEALSLDEGTPQAMLSALMPSGGCQLRHSPVGFRSQFHCTPVPQWVAAKSASGGTLSARYTQALDRLCALLGI